jgi:recombination associated protein RdgC
MFFKNLLIYHLVEPFRLSIPEFSECLKASTYLPCPRSESFSVGWVSPYGMDHESYVHAMQGFILFAFCKEEKLLPASVIRDALNKEIAELEQREDRPIYRKERTELKERVIMTLRHQAFSRKKINFAYLDTTQNYLLIDTASRNKAEEICSYLRKTLGSLKLALLSTRSQPEIIMTSWLTENQHPAYFRIENNCDMLDAKQKMGMIKVKEQDLNTEDIIRHLYAGKRIVKLALNWEDRITFEFSDDLSIKKIKFLDLIQNQRERYKSQSYPEQLDGDFAIMTGEFSRFLTDLWALFDGLEPVTA